MITKEKDYCQCGEDTPITWLGTCEGCGKEFLFPRHRKRVTHPRPFSEGKQLLVAEVEREKKLWGHTNLDLDIWRDIWHKLLDMEFVSIHGGFFLLGCGIFCNPRLYRMCELYFTTKEGAELWRELEYSGALYGLDICRKEVGE